jgi:hypothetical protein
MTLRSYIWSLRVFTAVSILALNLIIFYVDPTAAGIFGKVLFYVSLFFVLSGIFNLFFLRLRRKMIYEDKEGDNIGLSFRQGALLALLFVGLLILQSLRILVWWDGLILVAGAFLLELYFLSKG